MTSKGRHMIGVRLDEEIIEALKARAGDLGRGRGGGVAHYLRVLAYRDLGLPDPEPINERIGINMARRLAEEGRKQLNTRLFWIVAPASGRVYQLRVDAVRRTWFLAPPAIEDVEWTFLKGGIRPAERDDLPGPGAFKLDTDDRARVFDKLWQYLAVHEGQIEVYAGRMPVSSDEAKKFALLHTDQILEAIQS